MTYTRHIPLDGVLNLRDLGGYATPSGQTPWRTFLRAASPHRLSPAEIAELEGMGLAQVIDLRFDDEIAKEPSPFAGCDTGARHVNISLFAGLDPQNPQLVAADDPLLELYKLAVDAMPTAFVTVLRAIAQADGAVLFHCSAGKDRTGLIAMMLLDLAGVDRAQIVADYTLTATYLGPLIDQHRAAVEAEGGDFATYAKYLASTPATMEAFLDHFAAHHGGTEAFLTRHGLTSDEIAVLRARLAPVTAQQGAA